MIQEFFVFLHNSLSDCFRSYYKHIRQMSNKNFAIILLIMIAINFLPGSEKFLSQWLSPELSLVGWVISVYALVYIFYLANIFPEAKFFINTFQEILLAARNFSMSLSLIVSLWMLKRFAVSILFGNIQHKYFFASVFLQIIFIPLYFKLPDWNVLFDQRRAHNKIKKALSLKWFAYYFARITTLAVLIILPIFLIGDLISLKDLPTLNLLNAY